MAVRVAPQAVQEKQRERWPLLALIGVVVLAAALRLYGLTAESLWYDETYSVWSSGMEIGSLHTLWAWQIEFPLFYLLLHWWMRLFGQGEFAVRAFGAAAGVLSVAPMYFLGRELFDRRVGLIGALLLAVNPYHVWYSQDVRMYPWAMLLTIASLYAFWRVGQGARWRWWAAFILLTGLTFHLHYYIAWIVLAENVYILWRIGRQHGGLFRRASWRKLRNWLLSQVGVGMLALPALIVFRTKMVGFNQWGWLAQRYGAPGWRQIVEALLAYSEGTITPEPSMLKWVILLLFLAAAAWGVVQGVRSILRREAPGEGFILTLALLVLPMGLVFVLGQFFSLWVTRYLILFLPAYLLLIAWGLARGRWSMIGAAGSAVLVLCSLWALSAMYTTPQKEDWRGVAQYLAPRVAPDDLIVLLDEECRVPLNYYYGAGGRRVEVSRFADAAALDRAVAEIQRQARGGHLWLVVSHAEGDGLEGRIEALSGLTPVRAPEFVGIRLVVYSWS